MYIFEVTVMNEGAWGFFFFNILFVTSTKMLEFLFRLYGSLKSFIICCGGVAESKTKNVLYIPNKIT